MFRVRETVKGIRPYKPGKPSDELRRELGLEGEIIKLASNENPLGPPPRVMRALRAHVGEVHLYPDDACYYLTRALAEHHAVDPSMIIVDRGSSGVIELAAKLLLNPGDEVVYSEKSFLMYPLMAQTFGAVHRSVPLRPDYVIDLDGMLAAITPKTKLVYLPNPNNPTGTYNDAASLGRFIGALPDHVVLALDEAYVLFADDMVSDYESGLKFLVSGRRNVFILRTFSKSHAMAGLRVGYGIGDPELVVEMHKVRAPFNVVSLSQHAALAALEDSEFVAQTLEVNRAGMKTLVEGLRGLGFETVPSTANFVLFPADTAERAAFLSDGLLKKGVIVRPMTAFGLPDHIRVTVGLDWQIEAFLEGLAAVLKTEKK
ncbi:MAG TPA: histidinol-phosphate transaminase [bacterium]|nr:histidinol-phosphate transaminase [bacterium]